MWFNSGHRSKLLDVLRLLFEYIVAENFDSEIKILELFILLMLRMRLLFFLFFVMLLLFIRTNRLFFSHRSHLSQELKKQRGEHTKRPSYQEGNLSEIQCFFLFQHSWYNGVSSVEFNYLRVRLVEVEDLCMLEDHNQTRHHLIQLLILENTRAVMLLGQLFHDDLFYLLQEEYQFEIQICPIRIVKYIGPDPVNYLLDVEQNIIDNCKQRVIIRVHDQEKLLYSLQKVDLFII